MPRAHYICMFLCICVCVYVCVYVCVSLSKSNQCMFLWQSKASYFLSRHPLDAVPTIKNNGVHLPTDMIFFMHCAHVASKAYHRCIKELPHH